MTSRVARKTTVSLCVCTRCSRYDSLDPLSQNLVRGRYVGEHERKLHVRIESAAAAAASHVRFAPQFQSPESEKLATDGHPALSIPLSKDELPQFRLPSLATERLCSIEEKLKEIMLHDNRASHTDLVFRTPPSRDCQPMETPDHAALSLQDGVPSNVSLIELERWLDSSRTFVHDIRLILSAHPDAKYVTDLQNLGMRIDHRIDSLALLKMANWEVQRLSACRLSEGVKVVKTNRYMTNNLTLAHPVSLACYVLIAFMNLVCGVSLKTCRLMISALRIVVQKGAENDPRIKQFKLPKEPRSIISFLDLEPSAKPFVCCPKCFEIYPFSPIDPDESPAVCSFKLTPESEKCNEPLLKGAKHGQGPGTLPDQMEPVRLYLYHELGDWIARLYSRSDIEIHLDNSILDRSSVGQVTRDILDTPELRNFEGPEMESSLPFLRKCGSEGRLIFSLNMDGFNPFTNKESGKKVTVCAIYMVCLNLPPAIRHNVENVFLVGIIPGSQEPSKEQINPLLRPLVTDLLVMWHHGFFLTSTPKYPNGRLVRGAVVPLVCDLPAARQMSGFADHSSSNFCSFCKLKAEDINNFNHESWVLKDDSEHRRVANLWKNAPSERRQAELYDYYGIRWSELLRLPYWNASKYTVIDPMHAFLLRMLQRHVRQIMGMSVDFDDGDGPSVELLDKDKPSHSVMVEARKILRTGSEAHLEKLKVDALRELCHAAGLQYSGVKKRLIEQLLGYRLARGWVDDDGNIVGDESEGLPDPISKKTTAISNTALKPKPKMDKAENSAGNDKQKKKREEKALTPEEIERALDLLDFGLKRKISTLRKPLLKYLCDLKGIDYPGICKGPEFVNRIEKWRFDNGIVDSAGRIVNPKEAESRVNKKGTKVLGRNTLQEIRDDMEQLTLPPWVAPAPSRPGTKKQGKFTADQWRSFCLINLTFTLTRLWGSEPQGSRKRRMLTNFLHLVTAIKIAFMRSMTPERAKNYTFHMHEYLTTLLDLYPGATISPYQHLALHFQSFLERFGPTHAWRCFPFERYNFLLQNIPTNMKFGELETTMFRTFCMGQSLRHLFQSSRLSPELDDLISAWEKQYNTDIRGTLRGDALMFNEYFKESKEHVYWKPHQRKMLPEEWYSHLRNWLLLNEPACDLDQLSRYAFFRNNISRLGETYRIRAVSSSESNIYYREIDGTPAAACIQGIFSHTRSDKGPSRTQTFIVINQYRPLPEDQRHLDHFRSFSFVAGGIYLDAFFRGSTLISTDEMLCHFARGDLKLPGLFEPCFVALPLDRS